MVIRKQDGVLECSLLSTIQKGNSVYPHRRVKKPENVDIIYSDQL